MVGRLESCFLLSYAVEHAKVVHLVPAGLELLRVRDTAFLNIVVCRVTCMRPALFPRWLGMTFWQVAYRLQIRATLAGGESIEGLFFLRSDVDRPLLSFVGNLMTDFRFHPAHIRVAAKGLDSEISVGSGSGGEARVVVRREVGDQAPSPDSVFATIEDRERLLEYAPFGLALDGDGRWLRIAEVIRDDRAWKERPAAVITDRWDYLDSLGLRGRRLERAMEVAPIEYRWRLGRSEPMVLPPTRD